MPASSIRQRSRASVSNLYTRYRRPEVFNQSEQTAYEIVGEQGIAKLRHYGSANKTANSKAGKPLLIVPPLAATTAIYDLFPERSLVSYLREQGHNVYMIDWGAPSRSHANHNIATYIQSLMPALIEQVRQHSGRKKLSLHGWSLGAMFCYCYAALGDKNIDKLVLLGSPCDYHAKGLPVNRYVASYVKTVERLSGLRVHRTPKKLWHIPGRANSLGFKVLSPAGTMRSYAELLKNIDDREYVSNHTTNASFLDGMVAYPGGVAQDILKFLITDNVLLQGQLPIKDCEATLADIKADVLLVLGNNDPIVSPEASKCLLPLMSSANCEVLDVNGGHMSIVSGSHAPAEIWPEVSAWLKRGKATATKTSVAKTSAAKKKAVKKAA